MLSGSPGPGALLAVKGYDTDGTVLACYSGGGFDDDLTPPRRRHDLVLIGLDRLYSAN